MRLEPFFIFDGQILERGDVHILIPENMRFHCSVTSRTSFLRLESLVLILELSFQARSLLLQNLFSGTYPVRTREPFLYKNIFAEGRMRFLFS